MMEQAAEFARFAALIGIQAEPSGSRYAQREEAMDHTPGPPH